jgi:NAD(P)-dependent dehydrogenase (short-subunit alcohol dehydrogenase family)
MSDVSDAVEFLLRNPAVTGVHLPVDGGWLLK